MTQEDRPRDTHAQSPHAQDPHARDTHAQDPRPRKRRTRSREKILAAAEVQFLAHGYLGTSMDAVTEQAGVSKQTVYAHFASKETLFRAVIAAMTGGAVADHRARVGEAPQAETVGRYLETYAREQLAVVITPRLMALRRLVIGEVTRFPDLGAHLYRNGPGASIDRLEAAIAHFGSRGALCVADPAAAADLFNWMVMGGAVARAMHLGDAGLPSAAWSAAHARECTRVFLAAYGPAPGPAR